MNNLYIGLVHYPVMNKKQEIVMTSVTPFDVHDIARSAYTFGSRSYYVINPSKAQRKVVDRLQQFWGHGFGKTYNPNRTEALSIVAFIDTIEEALCQIHAQTNQKPLVVCTSAKISHPQKTISVKDFVKVTSENPVLLLFGTGWGLASTVLQQADYILEPITGISAYNHLSVRAAAAIILYQLHKETGK